MAGGVWQARLFIPVSQKFFTEQLVYAMCCASNCGTAEEVLAFLLLIKELGEANKSSLSSSLKTN